MTPHQVRLALSAARRQDRRDHWLGVALWLGLAVVSVAPLVVAMLMEWEVVQ